MDKKDEKIAGIKPADHDRKAKEEQEQQQLQDTLGKIKQKLLVLSGKGGVGKSTVAVNIAVSLSRRGYKVGLLDIDVHGPSVPTLLGLGKEKLVGTPEGKLLPIQYNENLKVISIGFMMGNDSEAVIWRGPLKYGVIKQFIKDVAWGDLDFLVVDSPPGTGDEPLSIAQLLTEPKAAVIVTTPQDVSIVDVKKSITFCNKVDLRIAGIIENMSGFVCPHCGERVDIFKKGGGKKLAQDTGVPYLGDIPMETEIATLGDAGVPFAASDDPEAHTAALFNNIIDSIEKKGDTQ